MKTLLDHFRFLREINPPMLAYDLARNRYIKALGLNYATPAHMYIWDYSRRVQ